MRAPDYELHEMIREVEAADRRIESCLAMLEVNRSLRESAKAHAAHDPAGAAGLAGSLENLTSADANVFAAIRINREKRDGWMQGILEYTNPRLSDGGASWQ